MSPYVSDAIGRMKGFWGRTSMSQRVLVGGLTVSVVVVFFTLIWWLNQPDFRVLYSNLYPEDASAVVQQLQKDKVNYKLENNGTTILVPLDRVYELRLSIAGSGVLHGQGLGFEIFDQVKVGQTDFVQRINYQRALQGELARTIAEFPQVDRARVHLVMPHKTLFIEDQAPPTASVVLKLAEGQKELEPTQVQAIVNLVALSVEGMEKDRISVASTAGKVLYSPKGEDSIDGMTSTQMDHKLKAQSDMERRIEEMLLPIYGPGRVIAKVNANLDFSQKTTHLEKYDPASAVVRSEQRSEETTNGQANLNSGVPEPNFRGDGVGGALSQQQATRETRTTNYEIDKTEQSIVAPVGAVDRISVAVIVDGTYTTNDAGETVFTPRSQEEIDRIKQLVSNAVGLDTVRGDSIEVSSISFGGPEVAIEPNLMEIILDYAQRLGKPFLNGLLVFLFLIMVVRPVVLALIRPKTEIEGVEGVAGLPEGAGRLAIEEGEDDEEEAFDALRKIDDIRAHAIQLSEQNMDGAMAIIKTWLKQPEGA